MLPKVVPAAVFSRGIFSSAVQFWNMLLKLVPFTVFSRGILCRLVSRNMLLKLVPFAVSSRGIVSMELQ